MTRPFETLTLLSLVICGLAFAYSASRLARAIRIKHPEHMDLAESLERLGFSSAEHEAKGRGAIAFLLSRRYKHFELGREALWGDVSLALMVCAILLGLILAAMLFIPVS